MRPLAAALLAALVAGAARAFPDRPITIVLPYSPGGAADAYARALGDHMARVFGQSVVVTNRDGGSGVVGMRSAAAGPPDGHTLGLTPMTAIVVQPHLVRNLGIGPESFAPVCGTNENVVGVVVRADSPARDLPAGRRWAASASSPTAAPDPTPCLSWPCGACSAPLETSTSPTPLTGATRRT